MKNRILSHNLTVLVATGILREARVAERAPGIVAVAGGGNPAALDRRLRAALTPQSFVIVSFGLCGALAPPLRVGHWVVGTSVTGGVEAECDAAWRDTLVQELRRPGLDPGQGFFGDAPASINSAAKAAPSRIKSGTTNPSLTVHTGPIFADGTLAASAQAKAALHAETSAIVIDMESHVAGQVAADHGLPFAILRVVSDTAADALPPAFAVAMRPDGGTDVPALLGSLVRRPGQLPAFIGAARDGQRALSVLARDGPRALAALLGGDGGFGA